MVHVSFRTDSACTFDLGIAKNLGGKRLKGCVLAPGIERQSSFAAGLIEKSLAVPILFHWNLGQEQAAVSALGNQ